MAFIEWKDEFSFHIPEVDAQHIRLLEIIDRLHGIMTMGGDRNLFVTTMDYLVLYTRAHCVREEKLLRGAHYPSLINHTRKHCAMLIQIDTFRNQISSGNFAASIKLMACLKDWLTRHILVAEKEYGRPLARISLSPAPRFSL